MQIPVRFGDFIRLIAMTQPLSQKHLFIIEDDHGRREYALDAPIYSIGRHPKCDIQVFSQFISRRHATLVQFPNEDGSFYYRIIDGNLRGNTSANGVIVNRQREQDHVLENGDSVEFGTNVTATYFLLDADTKVSNLPEDVSTTLINLKGAKVEV